MKTTIKICSILGVISKIVLAILWLVFGVCSIVVLSQYIADPTGCSLVFIQGEAGYSKTITMFAFMIFAGFAFSFVFLLGTLFEMFLMIKTSKPKKGKKTLKPFATLSIIFGGCSIAPSLVGAFVVFLSKPSAWGEEFSDDEDEEEKPKHKKEKNEKVKDAKVKPIKEKVEGEKKEKKPSKAMSMLFGKDNPIYKQNKAVLEKIKAKKEKDKIEE